MTPIYASLSPTSELSGYSPPLNPPLETRRQHAAHVKPPPAMAAELLSALDIGRKSVPASLQSEPGARLLQIDTQTIPLSQ